MTGNETGGNKPIYIVDEEGSVQPEALRVMQMGGILSSLMYKSGDMARLAQDLMGIADSLSRERKEEPANLRVAKNPYTFPEEDQLREDVITLADLLRRMNMRLWKSTRAVGTAVEKFAKEIDVEEDLQLSADVEAFVSSDVK